MLGKAALPVLLLTGCGDPVAVSLLRDGCYYSETGVPTLRVRGDRGEVLVPGDIRDVHLVARVGRDGGYVEVFPGFTISPSRATRIGPPSITTPFKMRPGAAGPTILANMDAYGEEPLSFRPCDTDPSRRAR